MGGSNNFSTRIPQFLGFTRGALRRFLRCLETTNFASPILPNPRQDGPMGLEGVAGGHRGGGHGGEWPFSGLSKGLNLRSFWVPFVGVGGGQGGVMRGTAPPMMRKVGVLCVYLWQTKKHWTEKPEFSRKQTQETMQKCWL